MSSKKIYFNQALKFAFSAVIDNAGLLLKIFFKAVLALWPLIKLMAKELVARYKWYLISFLILLPAMISLAIFSAFYHWPSIYLLITIFLLGSLMLLFKLWVIIAISLHFERVFIPFALAIYHQQSFTEEQIKKALAPSLAGVRLSFIRLVLISLGFVAFFIPGIVLLLISYFFTYDLINKELYNKTLSEVWSSSARITKGARLKLGGAAILFAFIQVLLMIPLAAFGVVGIAAYLLIAPFKLFFNVYIYSKLLKQQEEISKFSFIDNFDKL